jgi:hypothetical protein
MLLTSPPAKQICLFMTLEIIHVHLKFTCSSQPESPGSVVAACLCLYVNRCMEPGRTNVRREHGNWKMWSITQHRKVVNKSASFENTVRIYGAKVPI